MMIKSYGYQYIKKCIYAQLAVLPSLSGIFHSPDFPDDVHFDLAGIFQFGLYPVRDLARKLKRPEIVDLFRNDEYAQFTAGRDRISGFYARESPSRSFRGRPRRLI